MHEQASKWRDRKLPRWAIAYLTAAGLAYQGLALLAAPYAWPPVVLRSIALLLAVGFLLTLVLAWFHGERGRQRVGAWELAMVTVLIAAGVILVAVFGPPKSGPPAEADATA